MLEEGARPSARGTNSFRKGTMKENNGILKEPTASESISKRVDDTENRDTKSVRECKEDTVTKITIVDELNETRSLPGEVSSDGSKRQMKNPTKIGDMATTDRHRCQSPLRDIIGKREQRREELDKMEGDLRQRLDMLECSIPAVMVWNIWRMSQGAPVCRIKRILEKQFKDTRELSCRSTPSCHYDYRIREVEAERKLALKKVEEARTLWSEKLTTLEERKRKLDEARRIQEEQKNAIERLNEETRVLQQAREKRATEMDEPCRCDDAQCKQRHFEKVSSVMSIESGDIQCLEKLQRLAEEEVIMKREIAELERREETYMRTLQQADELWSKMEGDMISTANGLQEQLDMKTAANQQLANRVCELEDALEKCRTRLATCRAELEKFLNIEKVEAMIGRDDDIAKVVDKEVEVRAKVVHRPIGRVDDVATVEDDEVLAKVEIADEEVLAKIEVEDEETLARVVLIDVDVETALVEDDKFVSVKPDLVDLAVDRPVDLVPIEDAESVVRPEDLAYEEQKFEEVREYLSQLDSLEELYKDDGEPCPPDFVCNDVVTSPTGMTDEELIALGVNYIVPKEREEAVSDEEREEQFRKELVTRVPDVVDDVEEKEKKEDEIPDVEIEKEVLEKMEKRVAEIVDVPVRETVTPQAIEEEAVDDRLVTMLEDRAPEVKIEADRGIVIQRDTILSWIDAIDTIRTTAAKHPDCHEVKKDADILAEQLGTYVETKPKEVKEENGTIITEAEEVEPVTKIQSVPLPSEETPAEAIDESELLPALTKEEAPIGIEPPTAVPMEDSFQPPTIPDKEELKDDTIPLVPEPYEPDIEKIRAEETRIEDIAEDTKEIEIPKYVEKDATVEDLINDKLAVKLVTNGEPVMPTDEETLVVPKIGKEEHIEENRKEEKEIPEPKREEIIAETEKIDETLPITKIEEFVEEIVDKEILQVDETKTIDIKETVPPDMEIIRMDEILEVPPVPEIEKIEEKEIIPAMDVIEVKEIIPEVISPTVDITEIEKFEPDKFPVVDVEKVPIAIEEKIEKPTPILDVAEEEKIEPEELLLPADVVMEEKIEEPTPILEVAEEEKIEAEELLLPADVVTEEKIEEPTPILEIAEEEKIEAEELLLPAEVVTEEKIEEPTPILDVAEEEKIEAEELLLPAKVVTEEKIEEPTPILDVAEEEKIEAEELLLPAKVVTEEKIEEPTPILDVAKEEKIEAEKLLLPAEVVTEEKIEIQPVQPTVPIVKREVPAEEIKPETVHIELKIPIAEIKPTEMEMPAIPQLVAQPYLIIAKIKEKELLQIIPAKQPCAGCYLQPAVIETARLLDIPQTDAPQTEIVQTGVVQAEIHGMQTETSKIMRNQYMQTEIVQTEAVKTELVQTTTQTAPAPRPPRMLPIEIIREYLKPAELAASRTEIADDRPEITGRKMLWRLKDQSTVTTTSIGSQTDKTSHVSHDRVVRDERERARVPTDELLRSIKIAAGLVRPDTEREIRTINYGGKSEEVGRVACNCCLCGRTPTLPSTGPRLEIQPQIDAKTAPPPVVAPAFKRMFIRPKIDHPIPYDRLCPDCKAKIQSRMPREKHHVEKIIKKISRDQECCGCASLTGKSCRAILRKEAIEKKDQACLAKISKRKTPAERKDDAPSVLEDSDKLTVEPLSPSCICFKLEKPSVGPIKKGNCYCAD